ncbi:MAG TPA: UrcA family protein, partial [Steroidobacteraceae bacterium]|nr:UrcA family protein [Steroidobacteraceae bacterium]
MSLMKHKGGLLAGLALVCAGFTLGDAAMAQQANGITLEYSRTELEQPGGAQKLYRRIQTAAQHACVEPDRRELSQYARFQECVARAVDGAVAKVDATQLTVLHRARQRSTTG